MNLGKTIRIAVLFGLFCCTAANALATVLYWDPTGTLSSTGNGSGTWDTNTTANWWVSGPADSPWPDTTGTDTATFGGTAGAYAINVAGNNTANALTFNAAGYTLSGGTVTLAGTAPTITANAGATINSVIAGSAGLNVNGSGLLALTGPNVYTGSTYVNGGTLQVASISPSDGNIFTVAPGAVLAVAGQVTLNASPNGFTSLVTGGTSFATGAGTLALLSTNSSMGNPDILANVFSNANWGVFINTAINLGSGSRFIGGQAGNNNYGQYTSGTGSVGGAPPNSSGDLGLNGPLYGTASVTVQGTPYNSQFEVVLNHDNSGWTGPLNIVQGAVATPVPNALSGNDVNFNPAAGNVAALYLFGQNISIGSLSGVGAGTMLIRNQPQRLFGPGNPCRQRSDFTVRLLTAMGEHLNLCQAARAAGPESRNFI